MALTLAPWVVASPVPTAVYGLAVTSDGTYVYAASGNRFNPNSLTDRFARYNPVANTWTTLAPMPGPAEAPSAVYSPLGNKIYVFGGANCPFATIYDLTRIYDIATNTWSEGAPMPGGRLYMGAGYHNGKIYLVGGLPSCPNTSAQAQTWAYDPATDTWDDTRAELPAALSGPGTGVIDGRLYVAGGRNPATVALNTLYSYNIAADTWTTAANLLTAVHAPGSAVVGSNLWVFGGGSPFSPENGTSQGDKSEPMAPQATDVTQIYSPALDGWASGPSLNVARSALSGASAGLYVVAVGGFNDSTSVNTTEVNDRSLDPTATHTPTTTHTATATLTPCVLPFTDVRADEYFYEPVRYLYCAGAIAGYLDNTYRPYNMTTRGQLAKMVVNAFNIPEDTGRGPTFNDVPPDSPFYRFVETVAANNIVAGYVCGGLGEPCPGRYFRPYASVTRGQLTKLIVIAAGWAPLNPPYASFGDVSQDSPFYEYVETAYCHMLINGYSCGGAGEPCPGLYFRPGHSATRGQIAKLVYRALTNKVVCQAARPVP